MFGISFAELAIVFLLVLLVMGPEKLPQVARWAGKGLREIRSASNTLRNALMVEDFDTTGSSTKKIGGGRKSSKTAAKRAPQEAKDPKQAVPGAVTSTEPVATESPATVPGSGLDQVDDEAFDRMLEDHYRIHRTEVRNIAIADALPSDDVVAVAIADAKAAPDTTEAVQLAALPNAEIAS